MLFPSSYVRCRTGAVVSRFGCIFVDPDSLERTTISLTPDELGQVWGLIEEHIKIEKKTLKLAREALTALKGKKMVVQEYLLKYLEEDEKKHNRLLSSLKKIKDGMYPYG